MMRLVGEVLQQRVGDVSEAFDGLADRGECDASVGEAVQAKAHSACPTETASAVKSASGRRKWIISATAASYSM